MTFREATEADLPAIVALLADDILGGAREHPGDPAYLSGFQAMQARAGRILLALDNQEIVACLQLDILPGISQRGMIRAQVEGVRVASTRRGAGIGAALLQQAITQARQAGATSMQLTTNQARTEAQRFYKHLGFIHSHAGMKLDLSLTAAKDGQA